MGERMIEIPALKLNQFGITFYQAALDAVDLEKLVRFEVLSYGQNIEPKRRRFRSGGINWQVLEEKIRQSEEAFQRPIIRKKIEELAVYYAERREHRDLPAIPGAVLLLSEQPLKFIPTVKNSPMGLLEIPSEEGILRTLDGQHRVLAVYAYARKIAESDGGSLAGLQIPTVIFDGLGPAHAVELFVTINTKHTRLKRDLIITLSGRKLYPEERLARAHDIIRSLNESVNSPLYGQIKILGVGSGKVSQAPLAAEMELLFKSFEAAGGRAAREFYEQARPFFLAYFRQIARVFPVAWAGRRYSLKTGTALRAFIRVVPEILVRLRERRTDLTDARAIGEIIAPWRERIGDRRFETEGEWRSRALESGPRTVEVLAAELRGALG